MLIVLRAGDAVPLVAAKRGEFFRWIQEGVGDAWSGAWVEIDLRDENALLPDSHSASGFIVTGSASSVTERARWMLRAQSWLREATLADAPIFGICFGHQMLAEALGGRVVKNPRGREIGTVKVKLEASAASDAIFGGVPKEIAANATHVDAVAELPPEATLLASTSLDPNAAFRVRRAWGVQFHPEIDADLMRGYLTARRDIIVEEGLPHAEMVDAVRDAPDAMGLMRSFVRSLTA
jgi:GMP synthase (glutamine-hydrolysing)